MMKTIRLGDTGEHVKIAQYLIKYAERTKADGKFDIEFEAHVKEWQSENGLTSDGIIGLKSWKKLAQNAPTCSTSRNKTSRYTNALQIALEGDLIEDGIFGTKTKKAVVAFQASANLDADGICGKQTWAALLTGEKPVSLNAPTDSSKPTTEKGKFVQPVDYKQYDSRWGSKMYSCYGNKKQTMKNSGCAPTSVADVVATLKDKSVDPYDIAELSMANGHRSRSGGTSWTLYPFIQEHYKFSKMIQTTSLSVLKQCLDEGGYVVCSMGPGYWTTGGHLICAWKYDDTYIYANDPASSSRKKQKASSFNSQRKQYFCFWP